MSKEVSYFNNTQSSKTFIFSNSKRFCSDASHSVLLFFWISSIVSVIKLKHCVPGSGSAPVFR
jgi:hypothetical protein